MDTTAADTGAPDLIPDAQCAQAVDLARRAVVEPLDEVAAEPRVPADHVGEHLGVGADLEHSATHRFACRAPGYVGWEWVVTLTAAPEGPQVLDVVLLPGSQALRAPAWLPWSERIRPGDLGAGDLLPTSPDDPRLVPGYTGEGDLEPTTDADAVREVVWELGLGRERVLAPEARVEAFARWYEGEVGPSSAMARQAPATCLSCGFLLRVGSSLGRAFGVCANEMSPADGRVVSFDFGCGAHSDAPAPEGAPIDVVDLVIDEVAYDLLDVGALAAQPATATQDVAQAEEAQGEAGEADLEPAVQAEVVESLVEDEADDDGDRP